MFRGAKSTAEVSKMTVSVTASSRCVIIEIVLRYWNLINIYNDSDARKIVDTNDSRLRWIVTLLNNIRELKRKQGMNTEYI